MREGGTFSCRIIQVPIRRRGCVEPQKKFVDRTSALFSNNASVSQTCGRIESTQERAGLK